MPLSSRSLSAWLLPVALAAACGAGCSGNPAASSKPSEPSAVDNQPLEANQGTKGTDEPNQSNPGEERDSSTRSAQASKSERQINEVYSAVTDKKSGVVVRLNETRGLAEDTKNLVREKAVPEWFLYGLPALTLVALGAAGFAVVRIGQTSKKIADNGTALHRLDDAIKQITSGQQEIRSEIQLNKVQPASLLEAGTGTSETYSPGSPWKQAGAPVQSGDEVAWSDTLKKFKAMEEDLRALLDRSKGVLAPQLLEKIESNDSQAEQSIADWKEKWDIEHTARLKAEAGLNAANLDLNGRDTEFQTLRNKVSTLEKQLADFQAASGLVKVEADVRDIKKAFDQIEGFSQKVPAARIALDDDRKRLIDGLEAVELGNASGMASLLLSTSFDPYSLAPEYRSEALQAKGYLEGVRGAILTMVERKNYRFIRPRVDQDRFDANDHTQALETPTDKPELAGRISRLRRAGLAQGRQLIERASVDVYVYDPGRPYIEETKTPLADKPDESGPNVQPSTFRDKDESMSASELAVLKYAKKYQDREGDDA